jgi:hypothetical protein
MNERSYYKKYKEPFPSVWIHDIIDFNQGNKVNTYQMLKDLKAIRYNIEDEPVNEFEKMSLEVLDAAISEISAVIINELPEYQATTWAK